MAQSSTQGGVSERRRESPSARRPWRPGPGILVTAAFVGPGTVATCTRAGADFGFGLLWVLIFATLSAIILQTMAGRLGVVSRLGLGEALTGSFSGPALRWVLAVLILIAVCVGAMAYEAGNITGSAAGLSLIAGFEKRTALAVTVLCAGILLFTGGVRLITVALMGLVAVMIVAFVAGVVLIGPDWAQLAEGLRPQVPDGSLALVIALIGTTIVPYNLFLHAAAAREHWAEPSGEAVRHATYDTALAVSVGGLISAAILIMAAAGIAEGLGDTPESRVRSASDLARGLEPVYGQAARIIIGIGLFAAGLTSAVAAPLAAAFVVQEVVPGAAPWRFRAVMLAVLVVGVMVSSLNINVVQVIVTAQFANGLMLPVVALLLLWAMNQKRLLGGFTNGVLANGAGVLVVLITVVLGLRSLARAFGLELF